LTSHILFKVCKRSVAASMFLGSALLYTLGVRPMVVMGNSMFPSLISGQIALLDSGYYHDHPLQHGDVVVFRRDGATYVKRVYALPGETVTLLSSDGYSWPVPRAFAVRYGRRLIMTPQIRLRSERVPPGHFFSLGDNVGASVDSRQLGAIPLDAVVGRVRSLYGALEQPDGRAAAPQHT
jgi:signal peptidase I